MAQPKRAAARLSQLPPGHKFRLFAKYRDGSPRPRFKYGSLYLGAHELEVVSHHGSHTIIRCAGKDVPLWPGLTVLT